MTSHLSLISYSLLGCNFQSSHNIILSCPFVTLSSKSFCIELNLIFYIKCQDSVRFAWRTFDTPVPSETRCVCVDSTNCIISILLSKHSEYKMKNRLAEKFRSTDFPFHPRMHGAEEHIFTSLNRREILATAIAAPFFFFFFPERTVKQSRVGQRIWPLACCGLSQI